MEPDKIDRREALKRTALLLGCTLSSSLVTAVMKGCSADLSEDWKSSALNSEQLKAAADLAEIILPRTETPGAKDAHVERFIDSLAYGFLSPQEKQFLLDGLDKLIDNNFTGLSIDEQNRYVEEMIQDPDGESFFRFYRQYAMLGFFTSEVGATQVLQYHAIPGYYSGCEPLDAVGGRTWA
ncbi:MAG: gluconate 2-dehydrogenase subunit 3 family protein [Balneolaceae bacterium]|nr:gluconate 2-dehydrogenase subunit 3 family protein [Balneolaceae bacterium]